MSNIDAPNVETGRKAITTAGTAERLSSTRKWCARVDITLETDATGYSAIGDSSVDANGGAGGETGTPLAPGATLTLRNVDLYDLYGDVTANGEAFTYVRYY